MKSVSVELLHKEREFVKVYKDFLKSSLLSENEKMVIIALKFFINYGDDQGKIYPSLDTLCEIASIKKRTLIRTLKELENKGIIKKHRRGITKSNVYFLADTPAMWEAENEEKLKELSESTIPYTSKELIDELIRRGDFPVNYKEPVSLTRQSNETDSSVKKPTCNNARNNACTQDYKTPQKENQEVFERYPMELVKSTYGYDVLVAQSPTHKEDYDLIINILYDALNTSKPTIRVMGEDKPAMVVISRLLKLSYEHIDYVLQKFEEISTNTVIKDTKAYLLTMLYQVIEQYHFDISNLVNYNMAHYEGDS